MAEPLRNTDINAASGVYDNTPRTSPQPVTTEVHREIYDIEPTARGWTTKDTVRWGPILAGLFTAISSLIVFAVLGLAVGLSTVDAQSGVGMREFGIGAGWWGAISALLAFLIGGFVAGCTASLVRGTPHGAVNGLLVWAVAIPMLLFLLAGGVGSILGTAGQVAGTAAQAAAPVAGQAVQGTSPDVLGAQATMAADAIQQQAAAAQQQIAATVTPERVEAAAQRAAPGAWWTLVSLLIALGAAVVGGLAGGRWHANRELEDNRRVVA